MKTSTRTSLTQSQMMIWMGQKLNPTAPLYNMILTFEINGKIDVECFEKAFQKLVDNNDVLRSVVRTTTDNEPFQEFYNQIESPLSLIDLSTQKDPYQEYLLWVAKNKGKLFDISKDLYETVLFKISEEKYIWYLNQHHLITDGGAIKFVYDEMNTYYQQLIVNSDLKRETKNTFESYASENSFKSVSQVSEFWKQKLDTTIPKISLYGNKTRATSSNSTRVTVDLGQKRTQDLKLLTADADIRAFTSEMALSNIFLTAISALLFKIGDQETFVLGVPHQNRSSKKERQTAGLFMQLLPLLINIDSNDTLIDLLSKVKGESFEVMKNALSSKPPSALLKTFNVVMNFIPVTLSDFAGLPVQTDWLLSDHVDAHHFIRLQIQDFSNNGSYKLQFDLNNEIFSEEQRQYLTQHFAKILDVFIANKNVALSELHLITEAEIKKIEALNNTTVIFDEKETLLSKFETQVHLSPNLPAIVFGEKYYSYQTLNEKANQVAHYLIQEGVEANDIIAVSLERSLEMVVYIYGILKAGAAYLPLDTFTPIKRLKFIADDADFKFLLFNHDELEENSLSGVKCLNIKQIEHQVSSLNTSNPTVIISPENLSYIIYTSGSTGEPKGVKCHHKGVCNRLNWMNHDYPITSNDTLIQKTPITFDVSVWELFWPLQVGAKLIIETPGGHKDPDQLIESIIKNKVSNIHFVPSMLDVFISNPKVQSCKSLNRIFCSGEALNLPTVKQTYNKLSSVNIYNLYGPTEASIDVTSWYCPKDEQVESIAIGYPVANTKIHIVDEHLNVVPIGMKGELCIGGVQVASGYLNREKLTNERFIDDIFSKQAGEKLYKTGDIARYRNDGAIEYLGRIDNQIKLRGVRIELGEIEKVMEKSFGLSKVIVVLDKNENLVAYHTGESINKTHWKNDLFEVLPEYMIPTHSRNLKELPLTKNGKVDRTALQQLDNSIAVKEITFVSPEGEIEELIAGIWKEVLHLEKVGANDNFISLGGHSLAAIRVTARINEEIGMKFPLNKIFELPTIVKYAKYMEDTLITAMEQQE